MKFVEGGQLDEVVRRTPMSIRHAAELIARVARTVHYAHEHGILHRDIKPGRSEEHTSELQSLRHLVCRLLLEKKKKKSHNHEHPPQGRSNATHPAYPDTGAARPRLYKSTRRHLDNAEYDPTTTNA